MPCGVPMDTFLPFFSTGGSLLWLWMFLHVPWSLSTPFLTQNVLFFLKHSFPCSSRCALQGRGGLMCCYDAWEQAERWSCYRTPLGESPEFGGPVCLHVRAARLLVSRSGQPLVWQSWRMFCHPHPGPRSSGRGQCSHHVPGMDLARLIVILAVSTLTLGSQTSPCVPVPGPAALASQCCAYTKGRAAEPLLVLLHLKSCPEHPSIGAHYLFARASSS